MLSDFRLAKFPSAALQSKAGPPPPPATSQPIASQGNPRQGEIYGNSSGISWDFIGIPEELP